MASNGNSTVTRVGQSESGAFQDLYQTDFKTFELSAGWTYDTRDRVIFPSRGSRHQLSMGVTVPGSDVEYYSVRYDFLKFWPLWGPFTLSVNGELAFAEGLGDTTDVPPYRNFFAGGPESVRGFQNGQLGPIDSNGNPYGGNLKTVTQWELMLPTPEKLRSNTRFSLFYDIGNVFFTGDNTRFFDFANQPVDNSFDFDELRQSFGLAVSWLAPLGTFRFSYAVPLNAADEVRNETGLIVP